jgi:predicted aconitase with swiveling domain
MTSQREESDHAISSAETLILTCHPGVGDVVEGEALVSTDGFSARYDLDRRMGVFSRESHVLYGQSLVDKILVFPTAKGGVATAWALLDMKARGVAPKGLIFTRTNPIMIQGAVLAAIALVHELDQDPVRAIQTGDWIHLDPERGTIHVYRR